MKKYFILMVFLLSFFLTSCGGDAVDIASGLGGPQSTPEDIHNEDPYAGPADEKVVAGPEESPDEVLDLPDDSDQPEGSNDSSGVADGSDTTDDSSGVADGSDSTDDSSGVVDGSDSTDGGSGVADGSDSADDDSEAADGTEPGDVSETLALITLDKTQGRWFVAERKELFTKAEFQAARQKIKDLRSGIRGLQNAIENLEKEKSNGKPNQGNSDNAKNAVVESHKKKIAERRAEIRQIRDTYGVNRFQDGIWTAWANETLIAHINAPQSGWYKLRIVAKNIHGPLPDDYSFFNVTVYNETTAQFAGGINVKATESVNHAAASWIYLPQGYTKLKLLWTNDSYKKGEYDANINIRRITLKYKGEEGPKYGNVRRAHQFSYVGGRFFWNDNTVRTYWSNQTIGFDYTNLKSGKYRVTVVAKNYGIVPSEYKDFRVRVKSDEGAEAVVNIKAEQDNFNSGSAEIDITRGTNIFLTWENDMHRPERNPVEDANIQYKLVKMERIGDSERSAVAAYLLGTKSGNMVGTLGLIAILGVVLSGFYVINRRRSKFSM